MGKEKVKLMAPRGYQAISIPKEVYEVARDFLEEHRTELTLMRIRSVPQLLAAALLFYRDSLQGKLGTERARGR